MYVISNPSKSIQFNTCMSVSTCLQRVDVDICSTVHSILKVTFELYQMQVINLGWMSQL